MGKYVKKLRPEMGVCIYATTIANFHVENYGHVCDTNMATVLHTN